MSLSLLDCYNLRFPLDGHVEAAVSRVLHSGRLFRYDVKKDEASEAALAEKEFADLIGMKYAVGLSSCSAAIHLALRALGVSSGSKVLIPAFTFVAVPSAVVQVGAQPVLVEVTRDFYICTEDLLRKITDETRVLLLSHMRGHIGNMDEIISICREKDVQVIEDAAHALGATWNNKKIGSLGDASCFSMQSYKMIDSGEGGMLTTNNPDIAAKVIMYSGSYDDYWRTHISRPDSENMAGLQKMFPCMNVRMSNLTAAIIRAQIPGLESKVARLKEHYDFLYSSLSNS